MNKIINKIIESSLFKKMMKDKNIRTTITKESFLYFFHFYYAHYVKYETADFQKEIIHHLEKSSVENMYICAFRGSAKSTLVTSSYPIWAILGKQQKKFCIIFCQTQIQAKQHMMNIKRVLEDNDLLKKDLGPFSEDSDEWGSRSLVFKNNGARITVASTEQSIRGLRHNEYRPDLIICDDVEDIQSTRTRESREKTYNWLRGEVMPSGDKNTRLIIVGNLLHEDSLLMRIKEEIELGKTKGVFKEYPLLDIRGECLWPGKYGSVEDIAKEKENVANDIFWQREYLLKIIPTDEQVIHREWIKYYDTFPTKKDEYGYSLDRGTRIGVDLAISQKETADYTSMVVGKIVGEGKESVIYICPDMINKRLTFPQTVVTCRRLYEKYNEPIFVIEDVAYQKALPQQLKDEGLHEIRSTRPMNDKRSRLALVSHLVETGRVRFPRQGAEHLINQIVNFGVEKHDDLADAFSILVLDFIEHPPYWSRVFWI